LRGHSAKHGDRGQRVADQIQRDLSELIRLEVKDPRIGLITITDVEVTPDYAHARVYYSVLPDDPAQLAKTAEGLAACRGFLRSRLGRMLRIHQTPELHFVRDDSTARAIALSSLIDQAVSRSSGHD
jgi:ribosome-binding factor A